MSGFVVEREREELLNREDEGGGIRILWKEELVV